MLEKAGFKESDIPTSWKEYWSFWCDKVQPAIRKATGQRVFGIGQPMGVESTDCFQSFYTFMDAYDVKLVDDDGKLLVDDPKVRQACQGAEGLHRALHQGLHAAVLDDLEGSGQQRRLPQQDDRDDAQLHDLDRGQVVRGLQQPALTPEQRAAGKKAYEEPIITASFPNKPDGTPMIYRADVKIGVIFSEAKNKAEGKEF